MKKKIFSIILCVILIITASSMTFAKEIKGIEGDVIITPQAEPCPYYPTGVHKYVTGSTSYPHYLQYTHTHPIVDSLGGITGYYDDWFCKIYKSVDTYCACGRHAPINIFSENHCHPL